MEVPCSHTCRQRASPASLENTNLNVIVYAPHHWPTVGASHRHSPGIYFPWFNFSSLSQPIRMRLQVSHSRLRSGLPPAPMDGNHSMGYFQEPSNRLPVVSAYRILRRSICVDLHGNRLIRGTADVVCIPAEGPLRLHSKGNQGVCKDWSWGGVHSIR